MDVTLISCTPDALDVLLFTKQTRLQMSPNAFEEVKAWPMEKKLRELEYMRGTIQSSWEFVDYTFLIQGVTRAFTHQLVRHRAGTSFAQQAQRAVNMSGFDYIAGPSIEGQGKVDDCYDQAMDQINVYYQNLLTLGARPQDARGVLPTNISTNICFKANLRTLHDMCLKRLCVKAQGEFQDVMRLIRERVTGVHPWAKDFLQVACVFNGTCAFPSYPTKDCPVKPYVWNPETAEVYGANDGIGPVTKVKLEQIWEANRAEAQPIV